MSIDTTEDRRRPDEVPERRDYTPPGRVRRILHDYRAPALRWMAAAAGSMVLFLATSAWAVGERYERRVTEMAYLNDNHSLEYVRRREAELLNRTARRERELAERER